MKNSQLDRLLRIAQRTGDRLIITDSEGKQPVVILSLDEYEALLEGKAKPVVITRRPTVDEQEAEEAGDMTRIEAAVEAANREFVQEPKVVPVSRRPQPAEPSEEQFYLEPV